MVMHVWALSCRGLPDALMVLTALYRLEGTGGPTLADMAWAYLADQKDRAR